MQSNPMSLAGKRVAVLMTDGVEQIEYTSPRSYLEEKGAKVILVSPKNPGEKVQGFNHDDKGDTFDVEMHVRDATPRDFDALLLPGGEINPNNLRQSQEAVDFIRDFAAEQKPIGAICHGLLTLIDAGVAESKHVTSWPSIKDELLNAGAEWTDEEVVIDGNLVTSRNPGDLPAFNEALAKELAINSPEADVGPSS